MSADAVGRHMPAIATLDDLTAMMAAAGWPAEQVAQAVGLRIIPSADGGVGGRIPDLVVSSRPLPQGVWLSVAGVMLVVEIISPGSEAADTLTKRREYAAAGIRSRSPRLRAAGTA